MERRSSCVRIVDERFFGLRLDHSRSGVGIGLMVLILGTRQEQQRENQRKDSSLACLPPTDLPKIE
jgi:hypothetical protein